MHPAFKVKNGVKAKEAKAERICSLLLLLFYRSNKQMFNSRVALDKALSVGGSNNARVRRRSL